MRHLMLGLFVVLCPVFSAAADPRIDETLKQVIDSRRSIESGEVLVQSVDFDPTGEVGELALSRVMKYEIAFQGDKWRTVQSAGRPKNDVPEIFSKEDALNTGDRIYYRTFDLEDPSSKLAVSFAVASDVRNWKKYKIHIFDPRIFGLFTGPFAIMHAHSLDGFTDKIPDSAAFDETELDGVRVRLVSYQRKSFTRRLWISPTQGWNVVRSEWVEPGQTRMTLSSKIGLFDGIWFPREMAYEEFNDVDKLTERNIAKVVSAQFNRPIKADRFELSGMQLAKGTVLFDAARPGEVVAEWDGGELKPQN